MHIHACMLALRTGRPVRMVYNREESFFGHVRRHPARARVELGRDAATAPSCSPTSACSSTAVPTRRRRRSSSPTRATSPPAPTRSPTCASTGTRCSPTTRRAGRCAGSAPCRPATPSSRRSTGWPARWASTRWSCACATRSSRAPCSRPARPTDGPTPVRELLEHLRDLPLPPEPDGGPLDLRTLPGGLGNVTHGEGLRRGVGYALGMKAIGYSGGRRRLLDGPGPAPGPERRPGRGRPQRRRGVRAGHRHRAGPDRPHGARRRAGRRPPGRHLDRRLGVDARPPARRG